MGKLKRQEVASALGAQERQSGDVAFRGGIDKSKKVYYLIEVFYYSDDGIAYQSVRRSKKADAEYLFNKFRKSPTCQSASVYRYVGRRRKKYMEWREKA